MTHQEMREIREYFDGKFATLEERMTQRFEGVERRFDAVDQRFDGVDQRFDGVDHRMAAMDQRLDALDGRLEREFAAITEQFVEQREYIEAVHERLAARMTLEFEKTRDRTG